MCPTGGAGHRGWLESATTCRAGGTRKTRKRGRMNAFVTATVGLVPVERCSVPETHCVDPDATTELVSVERCYPNNRVETLLHAGKPHGGDVPQFCDLSGMEHSSTETSSVLGGCTHETAEPCQFSSAELVD